MLKGLGFRGLGFLLRRDLEGYGVRSFRVLGFLWFQVPFRCGALKA